MPDKKLTDKEIIKALECCISDKPCSKTKCPFYKNGCENGIYSLEKSALDLINRLQARVEKCEKVEHFADKTIATLQAENERLNNCVKSEDEIKAIMKVTMEPMVRAITNEQIDTAVKLAKAEAYKECIEKVKDLRRNYTGYAFDKKLDNLLKEMRDSDES